MALVHDQRMPSTELDTHPTAAHVLHRETPRRPVRYVLADRHPHPERKRLRHLVGLDSLRTASFLWPEVVFIECFTHAKVYPTMIRRKPFKTKPKKNPMPKGRWEEVMERDQWNCQGNLMGHPHRCGGKLEVNHIRNRGMGGSSDPAVHDLDNLQVLCSAAHQWVTTHPERAKELGLSR
jgi:hypothetical protein